MSLSLYNIENEYRLLAQELINSGGELTSEIETALAINKSNLETKAINYGLVVKELEYEIDAIKAEKNRLDILLKSRSNAIDRLKEAVSLSMQLYEIEEIKTPTMKLNFRKSESVEIENIALLDQKFMVEKLTVTPDKALIKEAIKAGESVEGARIEQHLNLQIK